MVLSNNDNQKSNMQFDDWKICDYSGLELYIQVSVVLYIYDRSLWMFINVGFFSLITTLVNLSIG